MSTRGTEFSKGIVGASTSSLEDNISALLINGVAIAPATGISGLVIGTAYQITKLKDAEAMGINAAYDTTNDVRLHRHISEFYRLAGEGTKLWFMVCAIAKTMKEMIEESGMALIVASGGSAFYMAVSHNPVAAYTPTYVDGLEQVVREAIAPAQVLHEWSWNTDRPINIFLEGRGLNGAVASSLDLRAITSGAAILEATHVSICVGQDWDYAETRSTHGKKFADVGTLLGSKAYLPVNRNIGEVETMDISNAAREIWVNAGLSNHSTIKTLDADLADYDTKGYIFGMSYTGQSGIRWNDDHVCSPATVDDDGYISISTIAHGAVVNKAARLLRKKLLPKVKSTVPVDTASGLLPTPIIKYFEGLGDQVFGNMAKPGVAEISGGKMTVDPASNLVSGTKSLDVSFVVVPTATIGKIKGAINLKTTL